MNPLPRRVPSSDEKAAAAGPRWVGADEVYERLSPRAAVDALKAALFSGFNPEADPARTRVATPAGTLLLMPSSLTLADRGSFAGIKLLTLTPGNAGTDLPVIQGHYELFGGPHQSPLAVIDGEALTRVRTPAVSALGAELLLNPDLLTGRKAKSAFSRGRRAHSGRGAAAGIQLTVFGTGVQAWEHARTFAALFPLAEITVIGRKIKAAEGLAARIRTELSTEARGVDLGGRGVQEVVSRADVVVTCTAAGEPLFSGEWVRDGAVVVAVGAHDRNSREIDDELLGRADVLVESRSSATAEAGEIVHALESNVIVSQYCLTNLAEAVVYGRRDYSKPAVFKTTGMSWEDLVLAAHLAS